MKQKKSLTSIIIIAAVIAVAVFSIVMKIVNTDKPPKLSLNGTELDLSKLKVSDLNEAGFYMKNNSGSLAGSSFYEMLSYYWGDNRDISMGGISLLNRSSSSKDYVKCEVFEITAKSRDKDGNLTGLQVTYNDQEIFGKTKAELTALFGEPDKELNDGSFVYYTKRNKYSTYFYFDSKTDECYLVEIHRREEGLVR